MKDPVITTPQKLEEIISSIIKNELNQFNLVNQKPLLTEDEYITFNETLSLLKISRPTLFKRMHDNTIPYRRIGKKLLFPRKKIIENIETSANKRIIK